MQALNTLVANENVTRQRACCILALCVLLLICSHRGIYYAASAPNFGHTLQFRSVDSTTDRNVGFSKGINNSSCSCFNATAVPPCCERVFHRTHKMGVFLTNGAFNNYKTVKVRDGQYRITTDEVISPRDYRDVILVRNIYESLASGYLYHKSGRECWLTATGEGWGRRGVPSMLKWARNLPSNLLPDPPTHGRSLCEYLAQESELVGMRAYMEWVFEVHYRGIVRQWDAAQDKTDGGRTLFFCFEDLVKPETDVASWNKIVKFLFPGSNEPWNGTRTGNMPYSGGHATNHSSELRIHLNSLVQDIDRRHFSGRVAHFDSILPCKEEYRGEEG